MPKQLVVVFRTKLEYLTERGEADLKAAVRRFREDTEYLGEVVKAELTDVDQPVVEVR